MSTITIEPPRTIRICGYCLDEGREEPRVRPCDEVDYGTCDRHARRIRRALSVRREE